MREEYYVPVIEDLFVGYEAEYYNWSMDEFGIPELNYNRWEKSILTANNILNLSKYGMKGFRVAYLTREQIEAEGWKVVFFEYKDAPYEVDWIVAEKGKYKLYINLALTKIMHLHIEEKKQRALYRGKCPSINEFRTIQKLVLTP